ncbi:MAG: hypothetical protein NZ693_10345, partial [Thermoflexales bacterium]|nr:hypothetical protein [Thermoflexales bacterium]
AASTNDIGGLILTGTVRITHTTVASNTGQGVAIQGNGLVLRAVAVANNAGGNCATWGGSVANSDYSVSSDDTCATFFLGANTLNNTPHTRLALLTFHPGTATWYHPTLLGSALHERVPAGDCVARDQLGQPRPSGSAPNCDTGAFEFQNLHLTYVPIVRKQP